MYDDSLDFYDDVEEMATTFCSPWKVLVVDDDQDVHTVTDLVMHNFSFEGRPVQLLHSYSGYDAKKLLSEHLDIAVVLLDVVMESDCAGLDVVTYLRDQLNNYLPRIVLRTGQPGLVPEAHVICQYDINDYKEKSDLTETKLKTTFFSSLRNYRDLLKLDNSKTNLKRTIEAVSFLHKSSDLSTFALSLEQQVKYLISDKPSIKNINLVDAYLVAVDEDCVNISSATKNFYRSYLKSESNWDVPAAVKEKITTAFLEKQGRMDSQNFIGFSSTNNGGENVIHLQFDKPVDHQDQEYLSLFLNSALISYERLLLQEEVRHGQHSTILLLGEAVEKRSQETGAHVQRVGEISAILARQLGQTSSAIEQIRQAAPLHDVGKIGIPDTILNKPGKFDAEEWAIMKTHARLGKDLLSKSQSKTLSLAAIIAHEHHECWDGSGYPRGLQGEDIHIAGRIVAITDVMDALVSKRCYKGAWAFEDALDYLLQEKHKRFDPKLVDIVILCQAEILAVYDRLRD